MNIKQKIIAGAVLAVSALISSAVQAYIPQDVDNYDYAITQPGAQSFILSGTVAVQAYISQDADRYSYIYDYGTSPTGVPEPSLIETVPMPINPSMFLRSIETPRFQTASQIADAGPLGFQIFCLLNPGECQEGEDIQVTYSAEIELLLSDVNRGVNSAIVGVNDVGDQWNINTAVGDCEEYVLTKRFQLEAAGLPIGALRIVTARTFEGVGHAVLVVRTDQGDLVLDNLNNTVKPWDKVRLELLSVSGSNPNQWYKLA